MPAQVETLISHEEDDSDLESALEERRSTEAFAGFSGRPTVGATKWRDPPQNALKRPGENWDQDPFKKKKKEKDDNICMVEDPDNPGKYLQAYFLAWLPNEVHLRIPADDGTEKLEWIHLRSSRLWRGQLAKGAWKYAGNGFWVPKPVKGRPAKKRRAIRADEPAKKSARNVIIPANDSEGRQDIDMRLRHFGQASIHTISGSLRTPRSDGQEEQGFGRDNETNAGTSCEEQAPQSEEPTERQQSYDDGATAHQDFGKPHHNLAARDFLNSWYKGHFSILAKHGQLDLAISRDCNLESGNTMALKALQDEDKSDFHSRSSPNVRTHQPEHHQHHRALKQDSHGLHSGPRSPSPSTPNKDRARGQNSSSEDIDPRSHRANDGGKPHGKQGFTSLVSASSPRSFDNLRAQEEKKRGSGWKLEERQEPNSGSSSSSGKNSEDSPDTVLANGSNRELKNAFSKEVLHRKAMRSDHPDNDADPLRKMSPINAGLPLKKRIKLALVETDPFASK